MTRPWSGALRGLPWYPWRHVGVHAGRETAAAAAPTAEKAMAKRPGAELPGAGAALAADAAYGEILEYVVSGTNLLEERGE